MNKKFLISFAIILCVVFSFSVCFAADGMGGAVNTVRNFVGGVENTVENVANGVSNASKDATGSMENGMNTATGSMFNNDRTSTGTTGTTMNGGNDNYGASRTATGGVVTRATDTDDTTIMGMNSTAWTWLILGITAIAIIAIVSYYSMQFTNNRHNND